MKGIHNYNYAGCHIEFDFDEYVIRYLSEDPIKLWEKVQQDAEYRFLVDCLITKHNSEVRDIIVFKKKYSRLCKKYFERYDSVMI